MVARDSAVRRLGKIHWEAFEAAAPTYPDKHGFFRSRNVMTNALLSVANHAASGTASNH